MLSSCEIETNRHYSKTQHRGNVGEEQLHIRNDNIEDFTKYEAKSNDLEKVIRMAYEQQPEARKLSAK